MPVLARMGIAPEDLVAAVPARPLAPTFAEYVPVVSAAVPDASRRAYGSYWKKIVDRWGGQRLDEPSRSEVKQLGEEIRAARVVRSNARGGTSTVENFITALRCLYNHRQPHHGGGEPSQQGRQAPPVEVHPLRGARGPAGEINEVAATTDYDPELDTWVERNFGFAVARAYAGHADPDSTATTTTYIQAGVEEVVEALVALTGEAHPLAK